MEDISYKNRARTDTTMFYSESSQDKLIQAGWKREQLCNDFIVFSRNVPLPKFKDSHIAVLEEMRKRLKMGKSNNFSFSLDTEFYEVKPDGVSEDDNTVPEMRYILSWQFTYMVESKKVRELIFFGGNPEKLLDFSRVLAYIKPKSKYINLIVHSGRADLTAMEFNPDLLLKVTQIQGGTVTLKSVKYREHNLSVRDTMCHAPTKMKSLADLGNILGIEKIEIPADFSKEQMCEYLKNDPVGFCEYGINDAFITLLYIGTMWGYTNQIPITISVASCDEAMEMIMKEWGCDGLTFKRKFRGLFVTGKKKRFNPDSTVKTEDEITSPTCYNDFFETLAKRAYHGGYNGCTRVGYYKEITYDYDLKNAYPTCMSMVPDVDWENLIELEVGGDAKIEDIIKQPFEPVVAEVDFEFPESVNYPTIPVMADGSLVYTRKGYHVSAAAPELYLAGKLGATIKIHKLFRANILKHKGKKSFSLFGVSQKYIAARNEAKKQFGKGSLQELLLKECVCSIYGKIAQNLTEKKSWCAEHNRMESIGASKLTSPYHAAMITSGVRAVMLAAMNQIEMAGYYVYSVTTDGFITNAPFDVLKSLDMFGFAEKFKFTRQALVGAEADVWETKHKQEDLLNMTTRGNMSLNVGSDTMLPGVMAHNGFVSGYISDSKEDRDLCFEMCLKRTGKIETKSKVFKTYRELSRRKDREDFSVTEKTRYLSMDFDLKRKPLRETMQPISVPFKDEVYEVCNMNTAPYETIEEFLFYKHRGRNEPVLRTKADWDRYFFKIDDTKDTKKHHRIKDQEWSKLVSVIMAYRLEKPLDMLGSKPVKIPYLESKHTLEEKIAWINKFNRSEKPFTISNWNNCRKQNRAEQILKEELFADLLEEMVEDE